MQIHFIGLLDKSKETFYIEPLLFVEEKKCSHYEKRRKEDDQY
jgi:hypothetical protein